MAGQNVLVKDLQGVETLGTCHRSFIMKQPLMIRCRLGGFCFLISYLANCMCQLTLLATDKTGTLTRNQMTVRTRRLSISWRLTDRLGDQPMELRQNVLRIPVKQ